MGFSRMPAALRRSFLAVLAVAATAALVGLVFAPAASAATGDVTISGRGSGHAEGMSQWGAWVAARDGVSYKKILAFYYPGTKLTSVGAPDQTVKVRLTRSANAIGAYFRVTLKPTVASATLVMHGAGGDINRWVAASISATAEVMALTSPPSRCMNDDKADARLCGGGDHEKDTGPGRSACDAGSAGGAGRRGMFGRSVDGPEFYHWRFFNRRYFDVSDHGSA